MLSEGPALGREVEWARKAARKLERKGRLEDMVVFGGGWVDGLLSVGSRRQSQADVRSSALCDSGLCGRHHRLEVICNGIFFLRYLVRGLRGLPSMRIRTVRSRLAMRGPGVSV